MADDAPPPHRHHDYDDEGGLYGSGTDESLSVLDEPGEIHDHPEAQSRRPVVAAIVAAVVVVAMIGAALGVSVTSGGDNAGVTLDEGDTPADLQTPEQLEQEDFDAALDELLAFVEQQRGLAFLERPSVELLESEAFQARLLADLEEERDLILESEGTLKALELLEPDADLFGQMAALLSAGVVGFYDPETDELVVRGTAFTPYVRQVLVHELVHALQDQHFELHRPELEERDDEALPAFQSLVEGDAVRIDGAYRATFSEDEQAQATQEELSALSGLDLGAISPVLPAFVAFPYQSGPTFVQAVLDSGGQERLDRAYAEPPTTTEHILHPDRYLRGEARIEVAPPPADGDIVDEGVLGAYALALMLGDGRPSADSLTAVGGWGGDWYVAWTEGRRSCLRATVVGDRPDSFGPLAAALDDWADRHDAAYDVEGGEVTITSCA